MKRENIDTQKKDQKERNLTGRKEIPLQPFAVTKNSAKCLFGSMDLVERLINNSRPGIPEEERWILVVDWGGPGRSMLIDYASLESAYERIKCGEFPPHIRTAPNGE